MIDLFTTREVMLAAKCKSIEEIERFIAGETMARINAQTGQENDLRYMAYRLQYLASIRKAKSDKL